MDDALYILRFAGRWVLDHPLVVGAVLLVVLGARWMLNRKSAQDRENERVIRTLEEGSRDKYKDLRPLR